MAVWYLTLLLICSAILEVDALPSSVKLPLGHAKVPTLAVIGAIVVIVVVILALCCCCIRCICFPRKRPVYIREVITNQNHNSQNHKNETHSTVSQSPKSNKVAHELLDFENRQFKYNDLERITNKFKNSIGTGGFGSVYVGTLENGNKVAVKICSHSSSQGVKEFLAEAKNLTRVHHVNLVSLVGYCLDENCMALVYEYMQEGTLQDKLADNTRPLTWKQRLQIAYESALGLEYLHKGCNPPLVHRDVKTNNILLTTNLEAKIADFGLSRDFDMAVNTHISTTVVGTPGYLDPEYFTSLKLSQKSDVYSFGVVLLEVVTGQSPIISGPHGSSHLTQWVRQKLSTGNLDTIVDPRMQGQYDINSVWKVIDLACKCTEHTCAQRPTMNVIVTELKESLDLEIAVEGIGQSENMTLYTSQNNYSSNNNLKSDISGTSISEMGYLGHIPAPTPGAR